jgi:hypothetical protein
MQPSFSINQPVNLFTIEDHLPQNFRSFWLPHFLAQHKNVPKKVEGFGRSTAALSTSQHLGSVRKTSETEKMPSTVQHIWVS